MHIISTDTEKLVLLFPKNLDNHDKILTIKAIKTVLLTYNKIYHFLYPGFYQVEVNFHDILGTILMIERLDELDFGLTSIDLQIIMKGNISIAFELEDLLEVKEGYIYQNKCYIKDNQLEPNKLLQLIEYSRIVLPEEMAQVITLGKYVHL